MNKVLPRIEPLWDQARGCFSCGEPALDDYLKKQAGQDARRGCASIFVAVDDATSQEAARNILGFYTLAAASIELDALPEGVRRKLPRYGRIPAALLGRLAVDLGAQGRGLGALLLADSLLRALAGNLAWAVFLVRAKHTKAAAFYRHFGFTPFSGDPFLLWLTRREAQKAAGL